MSEINFFGLSRGHYDPLANLERPLVIPERPIVRPSVPPLSPPPPPRRAHQVMDMVKPKPVPPPKPTPPPPKPTSPAIQMDDLLSDFIEPKPKVKKLPRKSRFKHKLAARRQAKSEKIAAKKVAKASAASSQASVMKTAANGVRETGFTTQALTIAADTTAMNSPAAWMLDSEGTAVAESENVLEKLNRFPLVFEFKINKRRILAFIRAIIIVSILAVSGYVAWDMWLASQAMPESFSNPVVAVAIDEASPLDADVTSISNQAWAAHTVPADQARYVYLPSINVRARVMSVGVSSKGKIDSSKNVNDVAWYDGSAKPGQEGQVFINGHSSFASTYRAAFDKLAEVQIGDRVTIERGDGKKITYRVVEVETIGADQVNMKKVLNVPNEAARGLTLMSCSGKFNYRTGSSDMRVIVYGIQE